MDLKKTLKIILKVALSSAAIFYVASKLDFESIKEAVKSANILLLAFALLIYAASQFAAAFRLNRLFRQNALKIVHRENIKLYWLGLFYNLFLPGGVGGDGYKVFLLDKYLKAGIRKTIGVILSDRVSGLSVIMIFLLLLAPLIDYSIPFQKWLWLLTPAVAFSFFLFLHLFNRSLRPAFFTVLGWAIIVQMLQMGAAVVILISLGVDLNGNYGNYLFLFFTSAIMGSIPITLGGLGAREITFLIGSQYLGINETYAVALSLLFYGASAITALPGIFFTINPSRILRRSVKKIG